MPYCENCGAQISESAKFCTECGTPLQRTVLKTEPAEAVEKQPVAEVKIPETEPVEQPVVEVKIPEMKPVEQPVNLPVQEPAASSTEPAIVQTPSAEKEDKPRKGMAVLAYLGLLVVIPLLFARRNSFARFHTNQGLVLYLLTLVCNCISELLMGTLVEFSPVLAIAVYAVLGLASVLLLVLDIIGLFGALGGKTKPLPLISAIRFLK